MRINSNKIEMLLAQQCMTKTALAKRCGIARNNISTIVRRGTCEPLTAGKLATGLGVSIESIVKKEE